MKNILHKRLHEECSSSMALLRIFFFNGLLKNILHQRLHEECSSSKAS
jgi:hypothetical protein